MTLMLRSTGILEKYVSLLLLPYALYCHQRNHKSLLPQLVRPSSHPSRDKRRLAELVLETLIHLGANPLLRLPPPPPPTPSSVPRLPVDAAARSRRGCPKRIHRYGHRPTVNKARRLAPVPTPQSVPLTPAQYWEGRRAFNRHRSQHAWFQRLWLVSSRFMWIHELHRVVSLVTHSRNHPAILTHSPAEKITFPVEPKKTTPPEPDKLFPPHAQHHTDARPT
ncbi:hypothetical protein PtA15_9A452 [Puccinia triticina]|uniref:N-acetylglucosaminylphosphatidylinositol deacetylase n=1 Tax=Puccinia triticina TaxID=208348 RepID=A0ABY7CX21_9BASI|nr:uncharacterized protein PtA15_9A452 [Puccinia triticina]WAQ88325.1 hypothetical protein PtA15_9A452 [Puccinia triticina]WAR60504.1 hypothetical protein PtB15_9B443 [Puccinia triticina]